MKPLLLILICLHTATIESKKKYPKIQEVVSFSDDRDDLRYIPRVVKEIRSSIDINKFRINKGLFRRQIRGNLDDTILLEGRRDNRRVQVFNELKKDLQGEKETVRNYAQAVSIQFRTKIVDCMLQLLYMGRHFIKAFERSEYLDKTTPSYRIGYIGRRLKHFFKKSVRILEVLNIKQSKAAWNNNLATGPLNLHHRVAKLNVEFEYYYELMKRLHARYRPGETPRGVHHVNEKHNEEDEEEEEEEESKEKEAIGE